MKKFTKLFLSCAAVTAVATAVGISAMAAEITGDVKGTFDEAAKTVTITNVDELDADPGQQVTFLAFKGKVDTDISADSIVGIDQGTDVQPTNNGLKDSVEVPDDGQDTYTVKVGYYKDGAFTVKSGIFKLGTATGDDYIIGDVNDDAKVTTTDANKILYFVGEYATYANIAHVNKPVTITDAKDIATLDKTTLIGDVNNDGKITTTDANKIKYFVGEYEEYSDIANSNSKVVASYDTEKVNTTVQE